MTDTPRDDAQEDRHRARTGRQAPLSPIWIVPIVALLIGAWLVYDSYLSRGPTITLTMESADGIEAGSTLIKTRNVEIGRVESVNLAEDLSRVVIRARMRPEATPLLVEDSTFWVVKPRIGREGISGLNTVLSGAYLQLEPGQSDAEARRFAVQEQPPVAPPGAEGLRVNLLSRVGNALAVGDPVTYQGFTVGRVEEATFDVETRRMHHRVFIESPYHRLVTGNTRFWTTSGLDLRLDSEGVRVRLESLEAVLAGGVTFGVPEDLPRGTAVEPDATFTLYPDEDSARQGTFDRYLEYVLLVEDTVRGLSRGAPVEFRGVRLGTVASVPWNFATPRPGRDGGLAIPVLVRLEPQRLGIDSETMDLEAWRARFEGLFERGLRATLKNGNLLTGALFVDLTLEAERAGDYRPETFADRPVLPSTSGGLAQIQAQVTALLDKLNALDVAPLLDGLERNLASSEAMLAEVRELAEGVRTLVDDPDTRALPGELNATLAELRETLEGVAPDAPAYRELTGTLTRLERLLRDLQPAARRLGDAPGALLFDDPDAADPVPRAPTERTAP
ncbi:intermembrane transport protein PqiB [Halomonas koreensis]|uniref:Intermembrane transport protein PqiB n=1 Tax=Halomonas koreensis TaxID=245385 RepID=A0ABU1FY95_9GAMM|nr:intermembrane transport protein PqiB [Halomonas koreensis]MDR5865657.1 intermembrane transport protein PqiB [Halomonas koreensis]